MRPNPDEVSTVDAAAKWLLANLSDERKLQVADHRSADRAAYQLYDSDFGDWLASRLGLVDGTGKNESLMDHCGTEDCKRVARQVIIRALWRLLQEDKKPSKALDD